jgi:hypothetical protein
MSTLSTKPKPTPGPPRPQAGRQAVASGDEVVAEVKPLRRKKDRDYGV